jgi:hypothetical protein
MFDGPHAKVDQYDGIVAAQPALEKSYVLIVDDWNWQQVRDGTLEALVKTNSRIKSWIEVRTTFDNTHARVARKESDWHNGYFIASCKKKPNWCNVRFWPKADMSCCNARVCFQGFMCDFRFAPVAQ